MSEPFFSVVIPTYNRFSLLKRAVGSVLGQSLVDFELLVIDDGSTDQTKDWLKTLRDARCRAFFQPNGGVASARNKGVQQARGEFVAFLDSDDWWEPNKLQIVKSQIECNLKLKIFHHHEIWYRNGQLLKQKSKHQNPDGDAYLPSLPLCCLSFSTAVIHRQVFVDVGGFDEEFEACEDYDFWLRATARYPVRLIAQALTSKDGGRADQLSSSVWGLDRFRIKALVKMLNHAGLSPALRQATIRELQTKCKIFMNGLKTRGRLKDLEYYQKLLNQFEH